MTMTNDSTLDTKFRRLESSDLPAVKDICSDVYDGRDTLPTTLFPKWIESESSFPFGVEVLNSSGSYELAGIANIATTKTGIAWFQGLRVHRNYRRMRLAEKLHDHRIYFCKHSLNASRIQYVTNEKNTPARKLAEKFGFRLIAKAPFWDDCFPFSLDPHQHEYTESSLVTISLLELISMISQLDPSVRDSLVPNSALYMDFAYHHISDPESVLEKHEKLSIYAEISPDKKLRSFSIIILNPNYNTTVINPNADKNSAILHMLNIRQVLSKLEKKHFDVHLQGKFDFEVEKQPDNYTLLMDLVL
eukprot:TRINITY_DN133_c0_g1_i2.p1 TRINITY_DN133_c0_g1~~TRINITY_DN133_c0_g1_i2.p1  ORF type:complete len:304 (+),score=45.97 TRINITY_DN133_c0_g1_i2:242-1153(+)